MHFVNFLLPLTVAAATLHPRQFGGFFGGFGPSAKLAGVDNLKPQLRPTAKRTLTKFGPYTLTGATGGSMLSPLGLFGDSTVMGQTFFASLKSGFCNSAGPCTVLAGRVGLQFTDGSDAGVPQGIYIHHILTSDVNKRQSPWLSTCMAPSIPGMSISSMGGTGFVGTGEDSSHAQTLYTNSDASIAGGFHVNRADTFFAFAQIVNYNKEPKQVYLTYDLEWVPGLEGKDVKGTLLAVEQCGPKIKLSTGGPTNTTSGKFYFMEDGTVIGARGHLHDGGVQVQMFVNDKYVCASKANYGDSDAKGHDGMGGMGGMTEVGIQGLNKNYKTISGMSMCTEPIKVKKGDAMSINVQYDLAKHPPRKSAGNHDTGVMGMWRMAFIADS